MPQLPVKLVANELPGLGRFLLPSACENTSTWNEFGLAQITYAAFLIKKSLHPFKQIDCNLNKLTFFQQA